MCTFLNAFLLSGGTNWKGDSSYYTFNGLGYRINNTESYKSGQVKSKDYVPDYTSTTRRDLMIYAEGETVQKHVYANGRLEQITDHYPGNLGNANLVRTLYAHDDLQGTTLRYTKDDGKSFAEMDYDAWGLPEGKLLNNNNGVDIVADFTGYTYDTILDKYFAQARFYDSANKRFMGEDPIKSGVNWYEYCGSNPASNVDPLGLEMIVVSGGRYADNSVSGHEDNYKYNFIDPAIKKLIELKVAYPDENITWLISAAGWDFSDSYSFIQVANYLKVHIVFISSAQELCNYINSKNVNTTGITEYRKNDKIEKFVVFSHGLIGIIALGFNYSTSYNKNLNFTPEYMDKLEKCAFNKTSSWFYTCNGSTTNDEVPISIAEKWSEVTGGTAGAYVGRTSYEFINEGASILSRIGRFVNKFHGDGSVSYPIPVTDEGAYLKVFSNGIEQ